MAAMEIAIAAWMNPTRTAGLTAILFALGSCSVAWIKAARAGRERGLAAVLTALEALLLLDMIFDVRWLLHGFLDTEAMANSMYGERFGPQRIALGVISLAILAGLGLTLRRFRGRPGATLAVFGGILSAYCWFVEVISLHAVDSLLYHTAFGLMRVSFVWISCSLMTSAGILWDEFRVPAYDR
jgi:hypothetical protein